MLPQSNAPKEANPWVRNVSDRALAAQAAASRTEGNAYAYAASTKNSYALIDGRIANINTFTNGLLDQGIYTHSASAYSQLTSLPVLYSYTSGDFVEYAVIVKRIPFAQYNSLNVTADGQVNSFTTSATATGISIDRPLRPLIAATIPGLPLLRADGTYSENATSYDARWTVENFEPFLPFDIPGNFVPTAYSSTYGQAPPGRHPGNGTTAIRYSRDGYTSYSLAYTREWLMEYMQAIADYTMKNSPPPNNGLYLAPDVNQVDIILGYMFRAYQGAATNELHINDDRLQFSAGSTFILEGIKNLGY